MQCTAGSTVKSGSPAFFQFDSTTVGGFLPFGASLAWFGFLSLPVGPVSTADFCSREPPDTTMSAADWLSLGIPPVALITGAYSRLADWIQQSAFSQYCVCNATSGTPYSTQILSLSPKYYLKLGEASGANAVDATGNGRYGTYYGSPVYGQAALMAGDPATSVKAAATPAGVVTQPTANMTNWGGNVDRSIEFFAKFTNPSAIGALYTNYDGNNPIVSVRTDTTGHVGLQTRDSAGTLTTSGWSASSYSGGTVHQYDVVFNSAAHTVTLYVDAVSVMQVTGMSTLSFAGPSTNEWWLDDPHGTNTKIAGTIGHLSSFLTALSATTISDNRAASGNVSPYAPQPYTPPTGGTPSAGTPPTCSTNQDVCNQLYNTNLLLQGISVQLTQFKTREQPSFWKTGTIHTGLTGSGVITVSDILGLNVLLTTVPSGWGATAETPRRLIPAAGSIQAGFASQYTDNWQVHYENEVLMLESTWALQVRYNFKPGITATLVELVPGT
jgi:hypothetical protein